MAYFRWILAYIDVLCQLFTFNIQKIDFWVQKWKNFEMLKIFNQAHVWGSSALIMLPHVLGGVCEQRGDPDDDFEYWMASLPRRGAEIWPDKVFWSKNQKFKKMHFYHLRPSWCIKMVLLGTNSSYVKAYITVGHFWGIWQEKKSFWAKISQNYNRKKLKSGKPRQALLGAHFIIQIAVGGSQFIPNVHKNDGYGPKIVFFGHCRPFGLNDLIITQNCKTASVGMAQ